MAVPTQPPRNVSTAAPGATEFPYGFKILTASDLLVQINDADRVLGVDYTVSGVGNEEGGNVTFVSPLAGGEKVLRKRNMAYRRLNDYQNLGDFRSPTVNADFDAAIMMIQQIADDLDNAILGDIPTGSFVSSVALGGGGGASMVGFLQAGAGAISRSMQDKQREVEVNVMDFIPTAEHAAIYAGTSTYDAAAHIASAQSLGLPVRLPAGTVYAGAITLTAPLVGKGRGRSKLKANTVTIGADNVHLKDIGLIARQGTAVIAANRVGFQFHDCALEYDAAVASAYLSADLFNVDKLSIRGCKFQRGGVQLSGCDDYLIEGNVFDGEYLNDNECIHSSAKSHGQIIGNTFLRMLQDGIDLFSAGRRCVVANNRFEGVRAAQAIECKVSLSDDPGNTSGATLGFFESTIITGNVIRDFAATTTGSRCGIYAEYVDTRAAPTFDITNTNRAIIITNNVLEDFNVTDPAPVLLSYTGIIYAGHNGIIANNVIRHIRTHNAGLRAIGIKLSAGVGVAVKSVGVNVTGNVIVGIENDAGIEHGSIEQCNISNNIVRKDDANAINTKLGINVVAGSTVARCNYNNNIFELNVANSFGIRATGTTGSFIRCNVIGNQFKDCGATVAVAEFMNFAFNQCDFAANSQTFSIGTAGTTRKGNKVIGNDFLLSDDYAVFLTDQSGYIISNNTFTDANRPVLLAGVSQNGIVSENVSYSQMQASPIITYSGVSAPDQATITDTGNKII